MDLGGLGNLLPTSWSGSAAKKSAKPIELKPPPPASQGPADEVKDLLKKRLEARSKARAEKQSGDAVTMDELYDKSDTFQYRIYNSIVAAGGDPTPLMQATSLVQQISDSNTQLIVDAICDGDTATVTQLTKELGEVKTTMSTAEENLGTQIGEVKAAVGEVKAAVTGVGSKIDASDSQRRTEHKAMMGGLTQILQLMRQQSADAANHQKHLQNLFGDTFGAYAGPDRTALVAHNSEMKEEVERLRKNEMEAKGKVNALERAMESQRRAALAEVEKRERDLAKIHHAEMERTKEDHRARTTSLKEKHQETLGEQKRRAEAELAAVNEARRKQ